MPTGYTAAIADGIDFRTFAMNCARAFGACVMLRDEGGGGEKIPEAFEPSDYHAKRLAESVKRLAEVQAMPIAECELAAHADWQEAEAQRQTRLREIRELKRKYEAMLRDVGEWTPPTPDHKELKEFMRSQIIQSIDFDCSSSYYDAPKPMQSGSEWRRSELLRLSKDIGYHGEENQKEIDRARQRTEWVAALRQSLLENVPCA